MNPVPRPNRWLILAAGRWGSAAVYYRELVYEVLGLGSLLALLEELSLEWMGMEGMNKRLLQLKKRRKDPR